MAYEIETWIGGGTFGPISGRRQEWNDAAALARLGKRQQLKRRFGFIALCGFACTILITWSVGDCVGVFENGGPAGLAWGFPISWLCSTSVYMVLAEMASMMPIAGGQYYWTSVLAPPRHKRFISYITGWLTVIAWIATLAVGMIFVGTIIQGIIKLNNPVYASASHTEWHGTLLSFAVVAVAVFINTVVAGLLPFLEGLILFLHILGFCAIMISMIYLSDHGTASDVFFTSLNEGGWPTQGLSYLVGYIGNVATFVGADAAVHMAEEIENAPVNVPRAMVITLVLNGAAGYAMALALLFCLGDIESLLKTASGFPFVQAFANATGIGGATVLTSIVLVLCWCAVIGFLATSSRMLWSFARDRAVPFHTYISHVSDSSSVPVVAIIIVTIIPCLLSLIYIGSPTAFEDVVSMSVSGLYASYLIPSACLLWRRVTNQIEAYDSGTYRDKQSAYIRSPKPSQSLAITTISIDTPQDEVLELNLMWGPWKVAGIFGTINNAFAVVYCIFVLFWDFWPPNHDPSPAHMNYAVLVTGFTILFAIVYYFLRGRKEYLGPLKDRELRRIQEGPRVVIDGSHSSKGKDW